MATKDPFAAGFKQIKAAMAHLRRQNATYEVERKRMEIERDRVRRSTAESYDRIEAGMAEVIRILSARTKQLEWLTEAVRNIVM